MNTRARILVIEDEFPMRNVLQDCLERHDYRVLIAADGATGLQKAIEEKPDLILLDIMLPKLDGFALCAELRRLSFQNPVLILTAKGRVEDKVRGLETGADDFLVKPFSRDELLARVKALLRRSTRVASTRAKLLLGDVNIDFNQFTASREGKVLHLTAKEFSALRLLVEANGECVSRERFLDLVWGCNAFPTTRTVDKHIASLRSKLEENPNEPRFIHTVHGVGYRLTF